MPAKLTPKVATAPLIDALGLINRIKAGLAEIGTLSVGAANRLLAGGAVNRLSRVQNSDYGAEAGRG